MLKNKRILLSILVVLLLLILPTMVNASNETPTINTEVYGANKSIKVTLTDITLDDLNEHKFGISKAKATQPTEWLDLQEIEASTCTAIITPENETHRSILRSGNKCYLFVKDTTNNEVKIITQIDLSLSVESALNIALTSSNNFHISYLYRNASDIGSYYITSVKIDDTNIIKKYLEAKKNNQDVLSAVESMLPTSNIPTTSWKEMTTPGTYDYAYFYNGDITRYQGLYMIWGQVSYSEGRTIYGYVLYDNYPNGYVLPEENEPTTPPTTDEPTIDTTQYVSFPYVIFNGTGEAGSLEVHSSIYDGNYDMYYQFVEVSDQVYNKIIDLGDKYENNEITYEEYFTQYKETITNYNDANWIKTKDGSFKNDLSNFTGTKKFALWVKLVMENKTVYEAQIYTMNGSGVASNVPDEEDKLGTDTGNKETTTNKDNTIAPGIMPYTGGTFVLIIGILGVILLGIYAYKRKRDLKGI